MSSDENRQIKLTVSVEAQKLDLAKQGLRDLTALAKTFVDTLNSAKLPGGLFGGATATSNRSTSSSGTGPRGAGQTATVGLGGLASGVSSEVKMIGDVVRASEEAIRRMTTGVGTALQTQSRQVREAAGVIRDLERGWRDLADAAGVASAITGSPQARRQGGIREYGAGSMRAQGGTAPTYEGLAQYDGVAKFGPGGWYTRAGIISAGVTAGMALLNQGQNLAVDYRGYQSQEVLQGGFDAIRRAAGVQQGLGGLGVRGLYDVNVAHAIRTLSPTVRHAILSQETRDALREQADQRAGDTHTVAATARGLKEKFGYDINRTLGAVGNARGFWGSVQAFGSSALQNLREDVLPESVSVFGHKIPLGGAPYARDFHTSAELKGERERGDAVTVGVTERLNEAINLQLQKYNPLFAGFKSEVAGDAMGRMAQARLARMGTSAAQRLGEGSTWSSAEVAGMMGQLGQVAGGQFMGQAQNVLGLQAGGLSNAAGILGAFGGYGSGTGALDLLRGASTMHFRPGGSLLDVAASNQIGSFYGQAMQSGAMFTSGEGGLDAMLGAGSILGGDLRSARAAQGGLGAFGAAMGGAGSDPLHRAIGTLAASDAFGGDPYAIATFQGLSSAQKLDLMAQIASGKITKDDDLPPSLRAGGLTVQGLRATFQKSMALTFANYNTRWGDRATAEAVERWRASGGNPSLLFQGLDRAGKRALAQRLGTALSLSTGGAENAEHATAAILEMAGVRAPKGGHVGDVASGTLEHGIKRSRDRVTKIREDSLKPKNKGGAGLGDEILEDVSPESQAAAAKLVQQGTEAAQAGGALNVGQVNAALGQLATVIYDVTDAIQNHRPYTPRKTAAPAGKGS